MRHLPHRRRFSSLLAAGVATMAMAALPATAQAASAGYAGGTITYTAARGEANHVTVVPFGFSLKLTDTGTKGTPPTAITVTAAPGCWPAGSNAVLCPLLATSLHADLGDGNDSFDASLAATPLNVMGGPGDDTLTGGTGADHLDGGAGNDTFETRDAAVDTIVCGTETDSGHADSADSVAPDCESVLKPAAPVVTPPSTGPVTVPLPDPPATEPPTPDPSTPIPTQPITPAANAVPPTVPPQTVGVSASGVASVRVVCPADSGGCSGTVTIEIPGATSSGGHAKAAAALKAIVVGKARFRAKAGTSPTIPVRLTKRGRQRILRGRRGRARIVVTTRRADGTTSTATQDVTIGPRRGKARHR